MNTRQRLSLLALVSLLPALALAKSPWDKSTGTTEDTQESAPAEAVVAEPVEPVAIEAPAPQAPDQESIATEAAPAETPVAASTTAPETIEVIETRGDVLAMPQDEMVTTVRLLDFPRRGMDLEKVQGELGAPVEIQAAVGQPPITRWVYADRVVYFERNTVLHVVAR